MRTFSLPASDGRFARFGESVLIEGAKKGESGAFEELARRYRPRVLRHLRALCRSNEDTEDILQNVLLTVYLKINSFRGTSSFSTWLYRITLNAFLMHERRQKRNRVFFVQDEILDACMEAAPPRETDSLPCSRLQVKEFAEKLASVLSELPGSYRDVLLLRDREDRSIREVSACLGLSIPAVKSRHHRARRLLRARLDHDFFN
jgi:RNA polymerase sigma-70 factor (ECF subfamily)